MKRALSLIIVLTMILCMIPFSAFAEAQFEIAEGDLVSGVITLDGSTGKKYLLKAYDEPGTLTITATGDEGTAIKIYVGDSVDDDGVIDIVAGQDYEIGFIDENMLGGDVTIDLSFVGVEGSESNPIQVQKPTNPMFGNATVELEAGASAYYELWNYTGGTIKISGADFTVEQNGEVVAANDDGSVEVAGSANFMVPVLVKITNNSAETQVYSFESVIPVGASIDNPEEVVAGEIVYDATEGCTEHYYQYIAEGDGIVTVTVAAADAEGNEIGWTYQIINKFASTSTDQHWSDDDPAVNSDSILVSEGDAVIVVVNTYDPSGVNPAGKVTANIQFTEVAPTAWGSVLEGVTEQTNDTNVAVKYVYTAEKTGWLYNSFAWENQYVFEGDEIKVTVYPGATVQLYYLPPVANVVGDGYSTEFYFIEEAFAAAWAGETITLLGDVSYDGALMLPSGVNLDLGDYTLTIGGLATFKSSKVVGTVGTASIVTSDLTAANVEIDGVEYEWALNEETGAYTLVEYKAPVIEDEEPIVAEFNGDQMSLSAALAAAAASAPTAENRAVVTLIANAEVDYNVIIDPYVTLNIGSYTLTAPNVIGLTDSMINIFVATKTDCSDAGRIIVPSSKNLIMSSAAHAGLNSGYVLLPVWTGSDYIFTQAKAGLVSNGWNVSEDKDTVYYGFATSFSGTVKNKYLAAGIDDNAMSIVVTCSYSIGDILASTNYTYTGAQITQYAMKNGTLSCTATGCASRENLSFQGRIITECGAITLAAEKVVD